MGVRCEALGPWSFCSDCRFSQHAVHFAQNKTQHIWNSVAAEESARCRRGVFVRRGDSVSWPRSVATRGGLPLLQRSTLGQRRSAARRLFRLGLRRYDSSGHGWPKRRRLRRYDCPESGLFRAVLGKHSGGHERRRSGRLRHFSVREEHSDGAHVCGAPALSLSSPARAPRISTVKMAFPATPRQAKVACLRSTIPVTKPCLTPKPKHSTYRRARWLNKSSPEPIPFGRG